MATTETQVQALEKELILFEKGIPELLEVDMPLYSKLEKTDSDPASNRATRIPLLTSINGTFQQADMNGADLGASSGPAWSTATLTPNYYTFGVSWTALAEYATAAGRGVKSATQETFSKAMSQFTAALDMLMNTGGNGVLGTITSVSTNTLTLTTDGFKEELFYTGMPVQVYNAALTTNRGATTVSSIDHSAHTVTVAAAPGGTTATDLLVIGGLSGTLTIQSSLFGVPYHQSDATSGLWLNLNRATLPNIVTPSVNANSSALTTAPIRGAINKIRMNIGDSQLKDPATKLAAYLHPAQADAYESLAVTISAIFKDPSGNQGVDLLFGNQENMKMSGIDIIQSIHADRTRIDFLSLGFWGRIVATDTGYYKVGDTFIFPAYNSGGTGLVSSKFFYLKTGLQIYNRNPWGSSYIKSLALPSSIY